MKIRELNREDAKKAYLKICTEGVSNEYFDFLNKKRINFREIVSVYSFGFTILMNYLEKIFVIFPT